MSFIRISAADTRLSLQNINSLSIVVINFVQNVFQWWSKTQNPVRFKIWQEVHSEKPWEPIPDETTCSVVTVIMSRSPLLDQQSLLFILRQERGKRNVIWKLQGKLLNHEVWLLTMFALGKKVNLSDLNIFCMLYRQVGKMKSLRLKKLCPPLFLRYLRPSKRESKKCSNCISSLVK